MPDPKIIDLDRLTRYDTEFKNQANVLQRSTAYSLNQWVYRGNIYLKCTTAGTTASTALSLSGATVGSTLTDGTVVWTVFDPFAGSGSTINSWTTGTTYSVGDLVIYNNKIYSCNTAHTATTFANDSANWTEISASITHIDDWLPGASYVQGDLVANSAKIYRCTTTHTSGSTFDSTEETNWEELSPTINEITNWASSTAYTQNQLVIYQNQIYQCTTAHTSTSTFDPTKWNKLGLNQVDEIGIVGKVTWEYTLLANHLALDGGTVNNFQATYPELYQFFNINSLITAVQADYTANKALCYYDSSTDTATMPDFLDKTVWGSNTIVEKKAGLPNIKGRVDINMIANYSTATVNAGMGAFSDTFVSNSSGKDRSHNANDNMDPTTLMFDASDSNSIYSDSVNTVQPPAIGLIPQIRYKKDSIIDVLEIKENLYTGTSFNTATTTVTTTSSMLNYDFIIVKLAYSDGTNVVMNKSYYIVPVVNEINDFTYFGGTTSYAKITGTITDSTHITFTFLEASTLTDFKVVSIDGVVKGSNQTLATNAQIDALF